MATKKEAQFAFEECFCAEMLVQMKSQTKGQQGPGDACAGIMAEVYGSQRHRGVCMGMMSQLMPICCAAGQESDSTVS